MRTIFWIAVDENKVVTGFGEAAGLIDPVATEIKIAPLLAAASEMQQLKALNAQVNAARQTAIQALTFAEQARLRGDSSTMVRQNAEYQAQMAVVADLEKQLPPLVSAFEVMRAKVTEANAAYFTPAPGESLIDDAQASDMQAKHAATPPGQALLLTGEYVTDLRGRDFWLTSPWAHKVIDTLGEDLPSGAITPELLTDAQRAEISVQQEADRVAALSPADRAAEAAQAQAQAQTDAAALRSKLEITGDAKALAKAQAAYADGLAAVNAKYGTDLA